MDKRRGKLGFWRFVIDSRFIVYYFTASFAIVFLFYSFIVTPKYISVGRLLPSVSSPTLTSLMPIVRSIMGTEGRLSRMARAAGLSLGASSGDIMSAILGSRTIKERVITQCNLSEHYHIPEEKIDDIVEVLEGNTKIDVTLEDMVVIEVQDRDSKMAKKIVDSYITNLDSFLKLSAMTQGKYERIFLEKRLGEAERRLKMSEDSLRRFQENYKIVYPPEEIKVAIGSYAQLKALLYAKEIEYQMKSAYLKLENPELVNLKLEIQSYRKKLKEVESKHNIDGFGIGSAVPLKGVPNIGLEYLRLYRDVNVNGEIYSFLIQLYEQAKITEARDTPVITVLDYGAIPEKPIFPKKLLLAIIGLIIGFCISIGYLRWLYFWEKLMVNPFYRKIYIDLRQSLIADLKAIRAFLVPKLWR